MNLNERRSETCWASWPWYEPIELVRRLARERARRRRRLAAIAELRAMSDAHLRDVGVRREEIEQAVDGALIAARAPSDGMPPTGRHLRLVVSNDRPRVTSPCRCDPAVKNRPLRIA